MRVVVFRVNVVNGGFYSEWMLMNFLCIRGGGDGVGYGVVVVEVASAGSVACGVLGVSKLVGVDPNRINLA
ncbi:hypothetical protein Tco_0729222 [Tanacetum coccineum]|uniref:Transmembrane protein n=1 Tax=Tanacetum coccineum TaxID=301880 RepID=A0ABQ4YPF9_9ASTR